jgi:hypothetical protein
LCKNYGFITEIDGFAGFSMLKTVQFSLALGQTYWTITVSAINTAGNLPIKKIVKWIYTKSVGEA